MGSEKRIFVFGSNLAGRHGKGAALHARNAHSARYGVAEGLTGSAYALPTKDERIRTLPLGEVADAVERFLVLARERQDLIFDVTAIGCGLAGYCPAEIAPMFEGARDMENVFLPAEFCRVLGTDRVSFDEHGDRP